jgi:flavin-dependent dehydrogenase
VLRAATHDRQSWVSRLGRVVEKRPGDQHGIRYDALVNAVRAEIPGNVTFIHAKAHDVSTGNDRQQITLSNGWQISARLVVLANGLNIGILHKLGMTREVLSAGHSISIGFDVKPVGRSKFAFPALTHYSELPAARLPYLTLFPIGSRCVPTCSHTTPWTIHGCESFAKRRSRRCSPRCPACAS